MSELLSAIVRTWWRYFVTGQPVRGERKDNATFLHAASQDMRGKPYEKLSGPIWHRLARRWAVLGVPLLFLALSALASAVQVLPSADPAWTRADWFGMAFRWWIIGAAVLLGYGIYRAVQSIRTREVRREFVGPAWEAACDAMGYRFRMSDAPRMVELPDDFEPPDTDPAARGRVSAWIHDRLERRRLSEDEDLPEDDEDTSEPSTELVPVAATEVDTYRPPPWQRLLPPRRPVNEDIREEPVRITLIPGKCSTDAEKNRFKQKVGPVLGMPDPQAEWIMRGRSPYVELRSNPPPPVKVTWRDVRHHAEAADIDSPVVGLRHGNRVEKMDFLNDSPHSLFSGASGTGKTTLLKLILSQRMHLGAQCFIFDFKVVSHEWALDLPGCTYVSDIADMHNLAMRVGEIVEWRKSHARPGGWKVGEPLNRFPILDVVLEESNALSDALQTYWTTIRQPGQPTQSPAVMGLRSAAFMGRQFSIFIYAAAQQATARIFGTYGGEVRESFQARFLAKPSMNTWKMLAAGVKWQRFPSGPRGIWSRIQDGEVTFFRVPNMGDVEAHEWALSGIPSPGQLGFEVIPGVVEDGETVTVRQVPIELEDEPELVTLSQVVDLELLPGEPMKLPALQKAAQRSGFPARVPGEGQAGLYRLEDLRRWRSARVGAPVEATPLRRGIIYQLDVFIDGERRIGYIGKTRWLDLREEQHRGDKPFSDLIIGNAVVLWEGSCTDEELGEMEEHFIRTLHPLYNIEFQENAEHAVPKWTQIEERHARDALAGRPPWVARHVYNERKQLVS